jgi:hypothetical protein
MKQPRWTLPVSYLIARCFFYHKVKEACEAEKRVDPFSEAKYEFKNFTRLSGFAVNFFCNLWSISSLQKNSNCFGSLALQNSTPREALIYSIGNAPATLA